MDVTSDCMPHPTDTHLLCSLLKCSTNSNRHKRLPGHIQALQQHQSSITAAPSSQPVRRPACHRITRTRHNEFSIFSLLIRLLPRCPFLKAALKLPLMEPRPNDSVASDTIKSIDAIITRLDLPESSLTDTPPASALAWHQAHLQLPFPGQPHHYQCCHKHPLSIHLV